MKTWILRRTTQLTVITAAIWMLAPAPVFGPQLAVATDTGFSVRADWTGQTSCTGSTCTQTYPFLSSGTTNYLAQTSYDLAKQGDDFTSLGGSVILGEAKASLSSSGADVRDPTTQNGSTTASQASVLFEWRDLLTVTSNTLSQGTPVQLRLTLDLSGGESHNSCCYSGDQLQALFDGGNDGVSYDQSISGALPAAGLELTKVIDTAVGNQVPLQETINGLTWAGPPYFSGLSVASSAAIDARAYVDPVTDAASYTTASGHSYLKPRPDSTPPIIACDAPDNAWHGADASISCRATDGGSGLGNAADASFKLTTSVSAGTEDANASTDTHTVCDVAGNCATAGPIGGNMIDKRAPTVSCDSADSVWHATNVSLSCRGSDSGSGLVHADDASFSLSTGVPDGNEAASASTDSRSVCDSVGNCATAGPVTGNMIDRKAPITSCDTPDGNWHANNVTLNCTAADDGAGAERNDQAFSVTTDVDVGVETANATTVGRPVCDNVGNCVSGGAIGGNHIDRKAPAIVITSPMTRVYDLNASIQPVYGCSDGGAGVDRCVSDRDGTTIFTGSVGVKTFTVKARDAVGNVTAASVPYTVSYVIYQPLLSTRGGMPPPPTDKAVLVELLDANNVNVSSSTIVLTATSIDRAIPQNATFTYSSGLYAYVLPKGLPSGQHILYFKAGLDPTLHAATFTVK